MNYSPDQWVALTAEVNRQGGALLPEPCLGESVTFPVDKHPDKITTARTCSCRNEAMAVTIYEPHPNERTAKVMRSRGAGFARICLVCDDVGAWPKFRAAVTPEPEPESTEEDTPDA